MLRHDSIKVVHKALPSPLAHLFDVIEWGDGSGYGLMHAERGPSGGTGRKCYDNYLPRSGAPLPNIASRAFVPLFYQGGEQRDRFTAAAVVCGLVREPGSISG